MPRPFENHSDEALAALVKDSLDWDNTGVLPDGILRIEADRYREHTPVDVAVARKHCRDAAIKEAGLRWMAGQDRFGGGRDVETKRPALGLKKAGAIGELIGVLARKDDGKVAAVTDLGRVTWLNQDVDGNRG